MSTGGKEPFDPRFDPAFQPGFTGPVSTTPRKSAPAVSPSPAHAALGAVRADAEAAPAHSPVPGEAGSGQRSKKANPFLVVLGILAVALVVGGLGTAQWIRAQFDQADIRIDLDYFTLDSLKIASPLAIALGIAIGAGVLFVYAINWQKRND